MRFQMLPRGSWPDFLDLPWSEPLASWQSPRLVEVARGISRHVVRFVDYDGALYALKELPEPLAEREYRLLRELATASVPVVEVVGVVSGRDDLDAVLITRHLEFSLPYRTLFTQRGISDLHHRLLDAVAELLVRLHLAGFFWGDCSLSNTLFRRDAGAFAAYLVDAETGELRERLSNGQREHDLDIARVNIAGELMDLEAGGLLQEERDPVEVSERIVTRYRELWATLTDEETIDDSERWRVDDRIRRLNAVGFDVDELEITTDIDGTTIRLQPKVVDAGHHSRRLLRLTGLDVRENQARRLLNDLDAFTAGTGRQGDDEEIVAHDWLNRIYEPVTRRVPRELTGKLEPAEVFHEVLAHRWYLAEQAGHTIDTFDAAADYVANVLKHKPDEAITAAPAAVTPDA